MSETPELDEFEDLAAYNMRVGQGIVHTAEFTERMAVRQTQFDLIQLKLVEKNACFRPIVIVRGNEIERTFCRQPRGHSGDHSRKAVADERDPRSS